MRLTILNLAIYTVALTFFGFSSAESPEVTFCHGGKLRGREADVDGTKVSQFLGVRYAKPPLGDLRFAKPQRPDSWSGVYDATRSRSSCFQPDLFTGEVYGDEDCLFLDINVPGGIRRTSKKAVMVWIHGGGYLIGEGAGYIGAPLAAEGDVIVVTINYRLGVLGFLFNGPRTGNYGLWDQRAAIAWVKENIGLFGGDPDRITIFGESAGGGSVTAQMMGQYNDGLFKRAVVQSGTLFTSWGWYTSSKSSVKQIKAVQTATNCTNDEELYDCLRKVPVEVFANLTILSPSESNVWHPQPDEDFFPSNIKDETYDLANRFDLMIGYNGIEGAFFLLNSFDLFLAQKNETFSNGTTLESTKEYLTTICSFIITNQAPELCANFLIDIYNITAATPRERLIRLSFILGDFYIAADSYYMLKKHSQSCATRTYAYHFNKPVLLATGALPWSYPEWASVSATHGDELLALFGAHKITDELTDPVINVTGGLSKILLLNQGKFPQSYQKLSSTMMKMWTNFAKSGNPNYPQPTGAPYWAEYPAGNKAMKLDDEIQAIEVPNKERLTELRANLYAVLKRRAA